MTSPEKALNRAGDLLSRHIGLRVEGSMRSRVTRAVLEGARARRVDPGRYVRSLLQEPRELQRLVDAITVQETSFFRDPQHFATLAQDVLPSLPGGGVIWSAGCATGQEPWTLAMVLEERDARGWSVLATDVSQSALAQAEAGRYTEREMAKVSPERRAHFGHRLASGEWEVGPRLRRHVRFAAHILAEEEPPLAASGCKVVFCRNVLIYLDRARTERALECLRSALPPDGWLFLGATEALSAGTRLFGPQRVRDTYVYRPRTRAAARPPAPAPPAAPTPPLPAPRRRPAPGPALPEPSEFIAAGEAHAAEGRFGDAAAAFRKASYLAPDDPLPLLGLGLALERGDADGARRAFRAARAALSRSDDVVADGWSAGELARLLDEKLRGT